MTTFLSFAFVLGVLVFVHELGHFLAAKRVGVKVLKFQLGFNPTIISFRRGDTEYGIGALPLGGYVKMAGENPDEARTGRSDEFLSKTKWERFQVLIMGPVMNLLLAVVLTALVLYQGTDIPVYQGQPPIVGAVGTESPAERAGIVRGDRILSVAGDRVDTWEDLLIEVGTRPNREVAVVIDREGARITKMITPVPAEDSRFEIGDMGVYPDVHPRIPVVNTGEPADRAGIRPGDVVLAVNGQPVTFGSHLRDFIVKSADEPVKLAILREGERLDIEATPASCAGKTGCPPSGVWLGIQIAEETKRIEPGAFEAVSMSVEQNVEHAGLILQTIWDLLRGETSPKQLMGPVGIAQLSGDSARLGWIPLFTLMASISLNLGLLNLLPIPVLDGGHITIMALEGVARRDFSMRVKEKMLLAGFVVLMMLMVTVIYNDLTRISWIERLMPWR